MANDALHHGDYDVEDYELLTSFRHDGGKETKAALARADAATLVRAYCYAIDEFADAQLVVEPLCSALCTRHGFTDDDLQLVAEMKNPASPTARAALGLPPLLAFYAVKSRLGTVMCFPWDAAEIGEARMNKGLVGLIRGIQAASKEQAEAEARRRFDAGQFEPTAIAEHEAAAAAAPAPSSSLPAPRSFPMETTTHEQATTTFRQPAELPDHPLLAHIPVWAPTEPEFQHLKVSIVARGVDNAILLDSAGRVVDGRNRRNACAAAGLLVPTRQVPDDEVATIIADSLGARRHVTKGAMAYLLAPLLKPAVEEARARMAANRFAPGASGRPLSGLPGAVTVESLADGYGFGRSLLFQALDVHKRFADHPELKALYEERILTGELSLGGAIQGMSGKIATEDKPRVVAPPEKLLSRVVTDLRNRFGAWKDMPEEKRHEVAAEFAAAAPEWPADLAAATAAAWRKAGLIS